MPSFDIAIKPDTVEVGNAIDQTSKEVGTRFDFKGTSAKVELGPKKDEILITGDSDFQIDQVTEIVLAKLAKRGVDIRFLDRTAKLEKLGGDKVRQKIVIKSGIEPEISKKMQAAVKGVKLKVTLALQGDVVRVTGNKIDDLQATQQLLRKEIDMPLTFENQRA